MDVIATLLLALTKNKIPSTCEVTPIKSLLFMPDGHSKAIKFPINMLGGPIESPINMSSGCCKYESAGSGLTQSQSFCISISTGLDQYSSHRVKKSRLGQFIAFIFLDGSGQVSFPSSHNNFSLY